LSLTGCAKSPLRSSRVAGPKSVSSRMFMIYSHCKRREVTMSIISHITLGTNDADRSGSFYDEVLGVLGFMRLPKPPSKPPAYEKDGMPTIYLYPPEDGRPATWGNGTHIAFVAETKEAVHSE
jgi:Glyoxalase/Bleomycin resistance protein/Dioxygenase superfamily